MSSETSRDDVDHTEPCGHCGTRINTLPGMDAFTEVTHYTTTGFESWVYCDTSCLRRAIGPDTDRAGGAADV